MMAFKICLFINQQLLCWFQKKTKAVSKLILGNQKDYLKLNFIHCFIRLGYEIYNTSFVVERNNCAAKKSYIVYYLDNWQTNPIKNYTVKIACLVLLI